MSPKSCLKGKVPNLDYVKTLLKNEITKEPELEIVQSESQSQSSQSSKTSALNKPKSKLFRSVGEIVEDPPTQLPAPNEMDEYLKMIRLQEKDCPFKFWQLHQEKFPNLSNLAVKFLAMPASSGTVERLFSLAGSIARSRRSRIKIDNLEQLLCYQDYMRSNLK
jgi:hypothetical protein